MADWTIKIDLAAHEVDVPPTIEEVMEAVRRHLGDSKKPASSNIEMRRYLGENTEPFAVSIETLMFQVTRADIEVIEEE